MNRRNDSNEARMVGLLQNLLAVELWRGGLPQAEIAKRIGVATATVSGMLKGVSRYITTTADGTKVGGMR